MMIIIILQRNDGVCCPRLTTQPLWLYPFVCIFNQASCLVTFKTSGWSIKELANNRKLSRQQDCFTTIVRPLEQRPLARKAARNPKTSLIYDVLKANKEKHGCKDLIKCWFLSSNPHGDAFLYFKAFPKASCFLLCCFITTSCDADWEKVQ